MERIPRGNGMLLVIKKVVQVAECSVPMMLKVSHARMV